MLAPIPLFRLIGMQRGTCLAINFTLLFMPVAMQQGRQPALLQFRPVLPTIKSNASGPATLPGVRKRVTKRKGNTKGKILILEYHRIVPKDTRYDRSIKKFKADLERLHKWGFRPVTLSEYLDNKIDIDPGATPVVFTFDDSDPSQFTLRSDGSLDPNCAVGIWDTFAKKHPDFPVRATFYVLPNGPFGQKKFQAKKVEMLRAWGSEIACHTWSHKDLGKLTDEQVKFQLAMSIDYVRKLGVEPRHLALPYGVMPKNQSLVRRFDWNGKTYRFDSCALAGSAPARPPGDPKLNPYRLPRVQAVDIDYGMNFWLAKERKGKVAFYVKP